MRIGLIGENSIEYINYLIDIWNNDDCAVLIDWRIPFKTAVEMMKEAGVAICYLEDKKYDLKESCSEIKFIIYTCKSNSAEFLPAVIYEKFKENYSKYEAIVLYSSGTTGEEKGIILSHYAINTNADAIIDYMNLSNEDCIYIAKVFSHSSTLTGELLVALKTRAKLVIAPTIVPPRFVFKNIEKFSVNIICLNPTLLQKYVKEYGTGKYAILTLKKIYVSGSILKYKIYDAAHSIFKDIKIYNVYGLSEAGPRITAQREDCCISNSVGKPIKDVEIQIVNDYGNLVKQGERGIIHVNTPCQFNGYLIGNKKNNSLYKGWLNTGDIGFIDENDELHILDRIDDVIIIDSHKIYPSDVETKITENTSITECVVVKLTIKDNEFIGCLYVGDYDNANMIKEIVAHILMMHEIPRLFLKREAIPRTLNGKIDKNEAKKLLENVLETEVVL